ncbi:MAG TPA: hypothetical protein VGC13_25015 [Longimicrobium sp.]|jgi:hypothetical protein|uniref:hypothetical protein n=1 Tax=Longimicrobium sp. TaxID=2029185 RepID=UPI002ED82578
MRKLKLESLDVESFETITPTPRSRGTVHGNVEFSPSIETYDIQECGDTRYFDCTYGCSVDTGCAHVCGASDEVCG